LNGSESASVGKGNLDIRERGHQIGEIVPGEFPLEGLGDGLIVILESQDLMCWVLRRSEVVRFQDFASQDGEVDLDLVQPAGMDGQMDQEKLGPPVEQSIDR
jgi:hypothetical protein